MALGVPQLLMSGPFLRRETRSSKEAAHRRGARAGPPTPKCRRRAAGGTREPSSSRNRNLAGLEGHAVEIVVERLARQHLAIHAHEEIAVSRGTCPRWSGSSPRRAGARQLVFVSRLEILLLGRVAGRPPTDDDRERPDRLRAAYPRYVSAKPVPDGQPARSENRLSAPTVNAVLAGLERFGIVEEITGRKRGRVFSYRRYIAILSEGTDPLPTTA